MGFIRYVSTGRKAPVVKVSISMNNGASWQNKDLLPGQSYPIPIHCKNLLINNVTYDPKKDYVVRDGKIISN